MAYTIKSENELLLKLTSVNLLMETAKAKVNNYMEKHFTVFQEMNEDEEAMQLFSLYYEENYNELIEMAADSLITSFESENSLIKWDELNEE